MIEAEEMSKIYRISFLLSQALHLNRKALDTFGTSVQDLKVVEECCELAAEMLKKAQGRVDRTAFREEVADVLITILGLVERIDAWGELEKKLDKFEKLIEAEERKNRKI